MREFTSAGTSMAPGFTGMGGNRPKVMPLVRLFSLAVDKALVDGQVHAEVDGQNVSIQTTGTALPRSIDAAATTPVPEGAIDTAHFTTVPLIELAWGRSGDKGNHANIGIVARQPEYLPYIKRTLQPELVAKLFEHYGPADVKRFDLPGIQGLNFMLYDVLGGGGIASLRNDPQGKGYAQILLGVEIPVPVGVVGSKA